MTKDDNAKAIEMYRCAIELDPNYAPAHASISWSYVHDSNQGWSDDAEAPLQLALTHARRSIELDDGLAKAHMALGDVHCWSGRHEQAIAEARQAISLEPSFADGHLAVAYFLLTSGQAKEALEEAEKALLLNPLHPTGLYQRILGICYYMLGQYKAAALAGELAISRSPEAYTAPFYLAAAYAQLGQLNEAKRQVKEGLRINPEFTIREYRKTSPFKNVSDDDHYAEGWRKAGLPE
jgi:adenylate cyclase